MLTVMQVLEQVARIKELVYDPEIAHGNEDKLWEDVLKEIANGRRGRAQKLASVALKTRQIKFSRWCA